MKKNFLEELTDEKLMKQRDLLKGVGIGFAIIYLIAIAVLIYVFSLRGTKNFSIATLLPLIVLPVTFLPIVISFSAVNKEIKSRNL